MRVKYQHFILMWRKKRKKKMNGNLQIWNWKYPFVSFSFNCSLIQVRLTEVSNSSLAQTLEIIPWNYSLSQGIRCGCNQTLFKKQLFHNSCNNIYIIYFYNEGYAACLNVKRYFSANYTVNINNTCVLLPKSNIMDDGGRKLTSHEGIKDKMLHNFI